MNIDNNIKEDFFLICNVPVSLIIQNSLTLHFGLALKCNYVTNSQMFIKINGCTTLKCLVSYSAALYNICNAFLLILM